MPAQNDAADASLARVVADLTGTITAIADIVADVDARPARRIDRIRRVLRGIDARPSADAGAGDLFAVDAAGRSLPLAPDAIHALIDKMIDDGGTLIAVVIEGVNGDLTVPVFGAPSPALLEALETVAAAYRNALKGQ